MPDPKSPAAPVPHAAHDRLLVAGLADRTTDALTRAELDAARALVADCPDCAALHADLVAIAAAVPTAAIPTRARDFRIGPADAERLRAPAWRRWLAGIGSPRDAVSRPLAVGLTTIGLAGLLVATIPGALSGLGGATSQTVLSTVGAPIGAPSAAPSAAAMESAPEVAGAAASDAAAPSAAPPAPEEPAATTTGGEQLFSGSDATDTTDDGSQRSSSGGGEAAVGTEFAADAGGNGTPTLIIAAGACLLVGLGLFGLRWTARRLGDG
jgi:hypothetical protein